MEKKEAMEILKDFHDKSALFSVRTALDTVLPELKESEDEKIRKELLEHCKNQAEPYIQTGNKCPQIQSWIAWLEKQNSYYTFEIKKGHWYKCICDYMLNSSDLMFKNDKLYYCRSNWRLRGEIDERNVKDIGVNGYKSFFRPATNQEIKDWLEKQGEQKPFFNIGDTIIKKHNSDINKFGQFTITDITGGKYWYNDRIICDINEQNDWELVEQKPAEKVEHKFNVGDWITFYDVPFKILRIEAEDNGILDYLLLNQHGLDSFYNKKYVDENARLWTISDAKEGDILQLGKVTAIFKEFIGNGNCRCYCSICDGKFEIPSQDGADNSYGCHNAVPATKEQREILFSQMKEAGFKWNTEKMELEISDWSKHIMCAPNSPSIFEEKSTWSEEDEKMFDYALDMIEWYGGGYEEKARNVSDWLKSLKQRLQ